MKLNFPVFKWNNSFQTRQLPNINISTPESPAPEAGATTEVALPSPGPDEPDYSFSPQDDEFISDHLSNYEDANERELITSQSSDVDLIIFFRVNKFNFGNKF